MPAGYVMHTKFLRKPYTRKSDKAASEWPTLVMPSMK